MPVLVFSIRFDLQIPFNCNFLFILKLYRGHIINQVRVDSAYIENRIGTGFSVRNDFGNKFAFKQAIAGRKYNKGFDCSC